MRLRTLGCMGLIGCTAGGPSSPEDTDIGPSVAETRIARMLRADEAKRLVVRVFADETVVVPGDPWARMTALLEQVTDKPDGIDVEVSSVALPSQAWTLADLNDTLDSLVSPAGNGEATIDVVVVRGAAAGDSAGVLGLGWAWSRVAVFDDAVEDACTSAAGGDAQGGNQRICEATWAAILRHETGHVLGLVNHGLPMVQEHEDPDHEHHDPDPDCLMFHAWDGAGLSGKVADTDLELCPAALADLAAVRDATAP